MKFPLKVVPILRIYCLDSPDLALCDFLLHLQMKFHFIRASFEDMLLESEKLPQRFSSACLPALVLVEVEEEVL